MPTEPPHPDSPRAFLVAAILTTALLVCEVTLWVLWSEDLSPWWQGAITLLFAFWALRSWLRYVRLRRASNGHDGSSTVD
ncbi:hypothetical protein [Amycolatopsis thermophila]|uniref:Cation transport ATPase n=1 Tax=Amycolatopsis thermophila TaxID=206084 RepID=A0ABU0ESC3_9PSEU|nr:hypothetical protein [Amycolatopsis thermophila]MDQ0378200.1 cation transport ATPase [Amycolatopsis thermophila]